MYVFNDDLPCRKPPWRNASEIRSCLTRNNIGRIEFDGASIMRTLHGAVSRFLVSSFAPSELTDYYLVNGKKIFVLNATASMTRRVFVTNLYSPYVVEQGDGTKSLLQHVDDAVAKAEQKIVPNRPWQVIYRKVWITAGWQMYERQSFQHFASYETMAQRVRERLNPKGWVEINYTPLTMAFAYETTVEADALHHVGPPLAELVQLLIDVVCTPDEEL